MEIDKEKEEKNKSTFFNESDFDAFNEEFATSEDEKIIGKRQYVVDNRLKYLHFDGMSGQGLFEFFKKYDLHPHWQKNHLTNVIWPFPVANGGWVNYVRMGYGKHRTLVKELAKRSGVFTEITETGVREAIAFFCVTQLQIGLNANGWWINLYIDKKGWIEQYNLIQKINSSKKQKETFVQLLKNINIYGYKFYIVTYPYEKLYYNENNPEDFIEIFEDLRKRKKTFSISLEKFHEKNSSENNHDILKYLKQEFTKLMPLYNFISWHPQNNNYLGI